MISVKYLTLACFPKYGYLLKKALKLQHFTKTFSPYNGITELELFQGRILFFLS